MILRKHEPEEKQARSPLEGLTEIEVPLWCFERRCEEREDPEDSGHSVSYVFPIDDGEIIRLPFVTLSCGQTQDLEIYEPILNEFLDALVARGRSSAVSAALSKASAGPPKKSWDRPLPPPPITRQVSTRPIKATVFRSGLLEKLPYDGEILQIAQTADAHCPPGRTGRLEGLFCSADMDGLSRWFRANHLCRYPSDPHEIRITGPEPYAYPVNMWDQAEYYARSYHDPAFYRLYWNAGVPLSQILAYPKQYRGHDWEILVPPSLVRSHRPVSPKRIIADITNASDRRSLMAEWYRAGFNKSMVWARNEQGKIVQVPNPDRY